MIIAVVLCGPFVLGADEDVRLIVTKYQEFDGTVSYSIMTDEEFRTQAAEVKKDPGHLRNAVHAARAEWTKIERERRREYRERKQEAQAKSEAFNEKFDSNRFPNLRLAQPSLRMSSTHKSYEEANARIAKLEELELKRQERKDSRKARPAHASSKASSKQADVDRRYEEAIESIRAHFERVKVEADMEQTTGLARTDAIDKRIGGAAAAGRLGRTGSIKPIRQSGSRRSESSYPSRKMNE